MKSSQPSPLPSEGEYARTACGSSILVTQDTPFIFYRNEVVYFCDQDCKGSVEDDPPGPCMAALYLSEK